MSGGPNFRVIVELDDAVNDRVVGLDYVGKDALDEGIVSERSNAHRQLRRRNSTARRWPAQSGSSEPFDA